MAMKQPKPRRKVSGMYDFQNIYTGDPKTSPGVIKAKADRAKADSAVAAYKKKSDAAKARAIGIAKADRAKSDSAVAAYKKKSDAAKVKAIAVAKMKKKK